MDIKENLANNLIKYRKIAGITQAELAEKLNYSDKAVSKWERGESVPDLYVLKQLADFYGTSIDTLISDPMAKPKISKDKKRLRYVIAICATMLVWLVAVCVFSFVDIIIPTITHTWMTFIYALPITFIVLVVLTAVWKKKITTAVMVSALVWTVLLAVYLSLFHFLVAPPKTLWEIFLIGIPLQIIIVFWSIYKKNKN
ncbi:MAG: helix-turn-helix transcriptional regulator [Clostridiales bacterium]|nr:helix-turn-helix transcriptional regulator [Clostridiales bacterium]